MKNTLRADAIAEIERALEWLRADEPLPMAGVVLAKIALRLMGKLPH